MSANQKKRKICLAALLGAPLEQPDDAIEAALDREEGLRALLRVDEHARRVERAVEHFDVEPAQLVLRRDLADEKKRISR